MGKWSDHESNLLREAIKQFGDKRWTDVSKWLRAHNIQRLPTQCRHRWHKTMIPNLKKGHWQESENNLLKHAVSEQQRSLPDGGSIDWEEVAKRVPGRTGKACRERWTSRLDPSINREPFSDQEEQILCKLHQQYHNKWAQIAKHLPGRTADAVKSKYISIQRRIKKESGGSFLSQLGHQQMLVQSPPRKRKQVTMTSSEHDHDLHRSPSKRHQSPVDGGQPHQYQHNQQQNQPQQNQSQQQQYQQQQYQQLQNQQHNQQNQQNQQEQMDTDMMCSTLNTLEVQDSAFALPHAIQTSTDVSMGRNASSSQQQQRKPAHSLDRLDLGDDIWDQYAHMLSPGPSPPTPTLPTTTSAAPSTQTQQQTKLFAKAAQMSMQTHAALEPSPSAAAPTDNSAAVSTLPHSLSFSSLNSTSFLDLLRRGDQEQEDLFLSDDFQAPHTMAVTAQPAQPPPSDLIAYAEHDIAISMKP